MPIKFYLETLDKNHLYHINLMPKTILLKAGEISKLKVPENIIIEIIENGSSVDVNDLSKTIKELRLKVAIEDFGNGASNFYRLELPNVYAVKLDRTLWNNDNFTASTKQIIKYLNKKNIYTIAEKVETFEEFKKTLKFGFRGFQGYLFAK